MRPGSARRWRRRPASGHLDRVTRSPASERAASPSRRDRPGAGSGPGLQSAGMGRRRRHLGLIVAAALVGATVGGLAGAAPIGAAPGDDGDDGVDTARAQLLLYLLDNTDLVPTGISCAP